MRPVVWNRIRDERGQVLAVVLVMMVGLLGIGALAVDAGMLFTARAEAQRTADAACLAGAASLLEAPEDEGRAREWAKEYAAKNPVRKELVTLRDQDIDVLPNEQKVRVRVLRTDEWGGPIATFLARVFGVGQAGVSAEAACQAYPALGLECILPLALPDRWCESGWVDNGDGTFLCAAWPDQWLPDLYEPDPEDWYQAWNPDNPEAPYTGYSKDDAGYEMLIKPGFPEQSPQPGWFYPFRIPGLQGAADYEDAICNCRGEGVEWGDMVEVDTEPGNMVGPTRFGFQCLIDKDPDAVWDEEQDCVTSGDGVCRWSPRIRPMIMFDPGQGPPQGMKSFGVANYVGVFIEDIEGTKGNEINIEARFVMYMGVNPTDLDTRVPPLVQVLRIVE